MELLENPILEGLTHILISCGERVEGNLICGVHPRAYQIERTLSKIRNLQHLVKDKKKICEIGVNACHSLLIMLLINPTASYLLFDLNNHKYTEPCVNYIKSQFPETKITVVYGDSTQTIESYIASHGAEVNTFDLCHIDGGHAPHVFTKDYSNVKQLANRDCAVIFDDYNLPQIRDFILSKIETKEINTYDDISLIKTDLHIVYKYAN